MNILTPIPLVAALMVAPLVAPPAHAAATQDADEQAELRAKYDEKVAKEFVSFGGWLVDYDEARAKAAEEGKLLFTYFSRSYSP